MNELYLIVAGFAAGAVNAIAGGGPILTLAALTAAGIDPRIANLTSTVALSPGQVVAGWQSRGGLTALAGAGLPPAALLLLTFLGGAVGAALLIATDTGRFSAIVPWLILLATGLYAWSGRGRAIVRIGRRGRFALVAGLIVSAIYGGYFGGGNSFIVLALLGVVGLVERAGAEAKNTLIASINLGAVAVFVISGEVVWPAAIAVGLGGMAGSLVGVRWLRRVRPGMLRPIIIACGLGLAGWFFAS